MKMSTVGSVSNNSYLDTVMQATKRNTVSQVLDAKQSGTPVDVKEVQSSNQELQANAKDVRVELYTREVKLNTLDTYTESAQNTPDYSNSSDDDDDYNVYTFDAGEVNDARSTAQERALKVAVYEQEGQLERVEPNNPSANKPVSIYV